jgi:hypothetical protein
MDGFCDVFRQLGWMNEFFFKFCQNYLGPPYEFFCKFLKIPDG